MLQEKAVLKHVETVLDKPRFDAEGLCQLSALNEVRDVTVTYISAVVFTYSPLTELDIYSMLSVQPKYLGPSAQHGGPHGS